MALSLSSQLKLDYGVDLNQLKTQELQIKTVEGNTPKEIEAASKKCDRKKNTE